MSKLSSLFPILIMSTDGTLRPKDDNTPHSAEVAEQAESSAGSTKTVSKMSKQQVELVKRALTKRDPDDLQLQLSHVQNIEVAAGTLMELAAKDEQGLIVAQKTIRKMSHPDQVSMLSGRLTIDRTGMLSIAPVDVVAKIIEDQFEVDKFTFKSDDQPTKYEERQSRAKFSDEKNVTAPILLMETLKELEDADHGDPNVLLEQLGGSVGEVETLISELSEFDYGLQAVSRMDEWKEWDDDGHVSGTRVHEYEEEVQHHLKDETEESQEELAAWWESNKDAFEQHMEAAADREAEAPAVDEPEPTAIVPDVRLEGKVDLENL